MEKYPRILSADETSASSSTRHLSQQVSSVGEVSFVIRDFFVRDRGEFSFVRARPGEEVLGCGVVECVAGAGGAASDGGHH